MYFFIDFETYVIGWIFLGHGMTIFNELFVDVDPLRKIIGCSIDEFQWQRDVLKLCIIIIDGMNEYLVNYQKFYLKNLNSLHFGN